jgi:hypothetical protein
VRGVERGLTVAYQDDHALDGSRPRRADQPADA